MIFGRFLEYQKTQDSEKPFKEIVMMDKDFKAYYNGDPGFAQFVDRFQIDTDLPEARKAYQRWLNDLMLDQLEADRREEAHRKQLEAKDAEIEAQKAANVAKDAELEAQKAELAARNAVLEAQDAVLEAQNAVLETQNAKTAAKEAELEVKEAELEVKKAELEVKEAELAALRAQLTQTKNGSSKNNM